MEYHPIKWIKSQASNMVRNEKREKKNRKLFRKQWCDAVNTTAWLILTGQRLRFLHPQHDHYHHLFSNVTGTALSSPILTDKGKERREWEQHKSLVTCNFHFFVSHITTPAPLSQWWWCFWWSSFFSSSCKPPAAVWLHFSTTRLGQKKRASATETTNCRLHRHTNCRVVVVVGAYFHALLIFFRY